MASRINQKLKAHRAVRSGSSQPIEQLERRLLMASISWTSATSGNFNNPANWSTNTVPTAADDVTVDVPGVTVTVSDAESVLSLLVDSPLTISSPTPGNASLAVNGGGVSINSATLQIGAPDPTSSGALNLIGAQAIAADFGGDVLFAGTASNANQITVADTNGGDPAQLSINGATINGSTGQIVGLSVDDGINLNFGTINADGGGKITIQAGSGGSFSADGTLEATAGTLDLEGAWGISGGSFSDSTGGTLQLGGTFSSSSANTITSAGGIVDITGVMTLDNDLNLNSSTGPFNLDGGIIQSGNGNTINGDSGGDVLALTAASGELNGISDGAGSPIDASTGTAVIFNGLTLTSSTLTVGGTLNFNGSQALVGTGSVILEAVGSLNAVGDGASSPATLSVGVDVQATSGSIIGVNAGDSVLTSGTIVANASGDVVNIHGGVGGNYTNSGTLQASSGTFSITGQWVNETTITADSGATLNLGDQSPASTNLWTNSGLISATNSTVNIGGRIARSLLGSFSSVGGTVNLTGFLTLDRTNQLTLDSGTGSWNLDGGTISSINGSLNTSEGSQLVLTPAGGTLAGGFTLDTGTPLNVSNGTVTITGGLNLNGTDLAVGGNIIFSGTQVLGGVGTVDFGITSTPGSLLAAGDGGANPATLTIGSEIVVQGTNGTIAGTASGDSIVNDGTIYSNTSGGTIALGSNNGTVTNSGLLMLDAGAFIAVNTDLNTTATSIERFGISPAGAGQLAIDGTDHLNGNVSIGIMTGFTPAQGTVFTVETFTGFVGAVSNFVGLTQGGAILAPATTATALTITTTFGAVTGLRSTSIAVVSSNQVAAFGDLVSLTATLTAMAGPGIVPTGSVSFFENSILIGTIDLGTDLTAALTSATLPAGRLMITASYSGDTNFDTSTSVVLGQEVDQPIETIGGLDPTYGSQGLASHPVGFASTSGVATQNGQSIVTGTIGSGSNQSFGVTRYNSDGTLDTAFGTGGVTRYNFGNTSDSTSAVAVLASGNVIIAGTAATFTGGVVTGSEFALAEFNPDGTLDTSFGNGTGEVLTSFSSTAALTMDVLHALVIGAKGNIYLGGTSNANGKGDDFAIAAFNPAGTPLTLFNGSGQELIDFNGGDDVINSLALQSNGDVVAAGYAAMGSTSQVALARFLPSGLLDKHFGVLGKVTTNVRGLFDTASSVVIQPNHAIVIGGLSATGSGATLTSDFLLIRYNSAGRIDPTFGGGPVTTSFGQPSAITQLVLLANGEILASGKTTASLTNVVGNQLNVALARYTAKGMLDSAFNGTGKSIIQLATTTPTAIVAADPADEIFAEALIVPLDASSLGSQFAAFTSSQQGVVAVTAGGAILAAGSSGANTVEAQIITAGVDLTAAVIATLPPAIPGGFKGTASVNVIESGTSLATGMVVIELQVATDAQGDGALTLKMMAERINLKQSRAHAFRFAFIYPATAPAGSYFLLATIMDENPLKDLNANNNVALSTKSVMISPPTTVLAGSALAPSTAAALIPGKPLTVGFTITNSGNIVARGRIAVDILLTLNPSTLHGTQIATETLAVAIPADAARVFHLRFVLPATVTAGHYTLVAVLDPANSLGATDHSDSTVVDAAQVTVS